ncbi:MAG: O-antigen ligase family protein [Myxococcota bacterium]
MLNPIPAVPDRFRPAALGTLLALPVLWMGAARPAGVWVLAAVGLIMLPLFWHRDHRASPSTAWLPLGVVTAFLVVGVLGLIPLPAWILVWVSPGTVQALPNAAWHPAVWDVSTAVAGWATWAALFVVGMGTLFAIGRQPVHGFSGKAAVTAVLWIAGANVVHHVMTALVGWSLWPAGLWAPLVNSNHLATVALLMGPVCLGTLARRSSTVGLRWAAGLTALWCAAVVVASLSVGAWLAAGGVGVVWVVRSKRFGSARWGIVCAALAAAASGGTAFYLVFPDWWSASVSTRWAQWSESAGMAANAPFLGVGPGGYARAFAPHQNLYRTWTYDHAHNDWLEFGLQIGLVGVAGLIAVLLLTRGSRQARRGGGAKWLTLGLFGVGLHAIVEFPLQLPGVAALVLGFAVVRASVWAAPRRTRSDVWLIGTSVVLALGSFGIAGWSWAATSSADAWAVADDETRPALASRVSWLDPTSAIPDIEAALVAVQSGDKEGACQLSNRVRSEHSHDAATQRWAARLLAKAGCLDDALLATERASWLLPADYRPLALKAAILKKQGRMTGARDAHAGALKRWPVQTAMGGQPLRDAMELFPVSLWWLEELEPAHPALSLYLGDAILADEPDVALLAYEQAARGRASYAVWPRRAVAMWETGDREGAHVLLDSMLPPGDPFEVNSIHAQLYARESRNDDAFRHALRALTERPDSVEVARLAIQVVDLDSEAAGWLELRLKALLAAHPNLRLRLARRYEADGSYSACRRVLDYVSDSTSSSAPKLVALDRACLEACPRCTR